MEVAYKSEIEAAEDPAAHLAAIRDRLNRVRSPFRHRRTLRSIIIDPRDTRPCSEFADLVYGRWARRELACPAPGLGQRR